MMKQFAFKLIWQCGREEVYTEQGITMAETAEEALLNVADGEEDEILLDYEITPLD